MENPNLILLGLGLVIFDEFRVGAQIRFKNRGSLDGERNPPQDLAGGRGGGAQATPRHGRTHTPVRPQGLTGIVH